MGYVRWLGHSAFEISLDGKLILIDPWLTGNPKAAAKPDDFPKLDLLLVTHLHGDHYSEADVEKILRATGATFVSFYDLATRVQEKGFNAVGMNIGPAHVAGLKIVMTPAVHVGEMPPAGFIIVGEEASIYHAGDTGLFADIELYARIYPVDIALLPIGGHFTMDPLEAAHFAALVKPRVVIPMHYGTFPVLKGTPEELERHLATVYPPARVVALKPGEKYEF